MEDSRILTPLRKGSPECLLPIEMTDKLRSLTFAIEEAEDCKWMIVEYLHIMLKGKAPNDEQVNSFVFTGKKFMYYDCYVGSQYETRDIQKQIPAENRERNAKR
jgi:hypothetical protein